MSCPDCFRGRVHSHAGEAKGKEDTLHGKKCYIASPPSTPSTSTSVIIYLTDSFGLNLINAKLLADRFAAETGCKVLMPDVIPGHGGPVSLMGYSEVMSEPVALWDVLGQLRRMAAVFAVGWYSIPLSIRILTWAAPKRAYPGIALFARAVREELPPGAKLGVVGFCWGGYGSTNLCKEPAVVGGSERLIDVQFCGHPYGLKTPDMIVDAVRTHNVPFSMAIGDKDRYFKRERVEETEAAMRQKAGSGDGVHGYNYEIKVYEGCTHGFVVRANPSSEVETAAAEQARAQAVAWLKKYL
jgi:dienelactone hydrolase